MAFTVPNFNLKCDVYGGPWLTRSLRIGNLACNLALGRRVQVAGTLADTGDPAPACPMLLVPALSDIRDFSQNIPATDYVEVPSSSGRWYQVLQVDDVGKGFSNEYRIVAIAKICDTIDPVLYPGLFWPTPMP